MLEPIYPSRVRRQKIDEGSGNPRTADDKVVVVENCGLAGSDGRLRLREFDTGAAIA